MGRFCVVSVYVPGPKTSASLPSFTKTAVCPSRTISFAPFLISCARTGKRQTRMSWLSSNHSMISMNWVVMRSQMAPMLSRFYTNDPTQVNLQHGKRAHEMVTETVEFGSRKGRSPLTFVLLVPGDGEPKRVPIEGTLLVGKHPSNDVVIGTTGISRYHLEIRAESDRVLVR